MSIDVKKLGKVAVLMGGPSAEREISLLSGNGVLAALREKGVDAHAFDPVVSSLFDLPREKFARAFVALHGSINRSTLSGYAVVRVRIVNGKPAGSPDTFLSGFIARDDDEKQAWGRPVGLLQMPDGSLLVSDDAGNRLWRVSYRGT